MTRRTEWTGRAALVAAALAVAALVTVPAIAQGAGEGTFRIDPPSQNADVSASEVSFTMKLDGAVNLAAWEFRFAFDPDILTYQGVTPSGFLAQTGRTQQCISPIVVTDVDIPEVGIGLTTVQYGCNTPHSPLPGVNGDGVLATVRFAPKAPGVASIICNKLELTDQLSETPQQVNEPCTGVIKITSSAGGGSNSGNNNSSGNNTNALEPTPTPNVRVLTPTAIPNAPTRSAPLTLGTPATGFDGSASGSTSDSSSGSGSSGAGGSSGFGSSGGVRSGIIDGVQAAGNFPVAGYGMAQDAVGFISLWGQLALLGGVITVTTGAILRRRDKR
jgi:hypothetical protein